MAFLASRLGAVILSTGRVSLTFTAVQPANSGNAKTQAVVALLLGLIDDEPVELQRTFYYSRRSELKITRKLSCWLLLVGDLSVLPIS